MTRETLSLKEGIWLCALAGEEAVGDDDPEHGIALAEDILAEANRGDQLRERVDAVLARARRLVASGECPALADSPALKGG